MCKIVVVLLCSRTMVLLGTHNRHLEPWRHTFLLSKVAASSGELQLPLGESASSWVTNFVVLTASRPSLCVVLETPISGSSSSSSCSGSAGYSCDAKRLAAMRTASGPTLTNSVSLNSLIAPTIPR